MSNKRGLYIVSKTLDTQARVLGLPLDEFIPAIVMAAFFFISDKVVLSIAFPVLIVVMIRALKRGQGSAWILNLGYWYLPKEIMTPLLRKTPPSQHREYLS